MGPSGKFLYVANEAHSVSIYSLNRDGSLAAAGTTDDGASPVSLTLTASSH
jgi:6-phosphogluconolactonase (cycloisomerase 2 family)